MRCRNGRKPENGPIVDGDVGDTQVVAQLILSGELLKEAVEIGVARPKPGSIVALAKRSDLERGPRRRCVRAGGSGTEQAAESPGWLALPDLLHDGLTGSPGHDELRVDDDVCRQFLQGEQVVTKGLFDEVPLLDAGRAHVLVEQLTGRAGDDGRDLRFTSIFLSLNGIP
jgi:hypothetical protein